MEINSIDTSSFVDKLSANTKSPVANVSFEEHLLNEIHNVNNNIMNADTNVKDLALGKNTNLHEVMLSIEDAKLSLEMLMKVRDKAMEGVQQILRMRI